MKIGNMTNETISQEIYDDLPEILQNLTASFEGREKDIVLLSSIGVLSACIPRVKGYYDSHEVYAPLYFLIIAPPASGKGCMNYSRILIDKIHKTIYKNSKAKRYNCIKEKESKNEKDFFECPPIEVKIIPANISTSEMYTFLNSSKNGVLIIESEADSMGKMMKNDWSNYSDVLRKAFHHEPVTISRKTDDLYLNIEEPKMSIVMSGTPDQLKPLIRSKENGLFSRFGIYTFDEVSGFKDVFATNSNNFKEVFEAEAETITDLYSNLSNHQGEIIFELTEEQKALLLSEFENIYDVVLNNFSRTFVSNLFRHGLILYRICMIFSVLNNKSFSETIICTDKDFNTGLQIVKSILKHSLIVHETFDEYSIPKFEEDFLFSLGKTFTRQKAVDVGKRKFDIPERTVDDKLVQWRKKKIIEKIGHGKFKCTYK